MRNEIDEDFPKVQQEVKKTLESLLIAVVEAENPGLTKAALESQFESKIQSSVSKQLAIDMVSTMYSHDENKKDEVIEEISRYLDNSTVNKTHKLRSKDEIRYRDLEKIVLDNLVRTHRQYLANVCSLFREHDTNNFGFISKSQFNALLHAIDPFNRFDKDNLYNRIDPDGVEHLTFSELVHGFADQQIENDEQQANVLDFIYAIKSQ